MLPMPDTFLETVHQALRDWYRPQLDDDAFRALASIAGSGKGRNTLSRLEPTQAIREWILYGFQQLELLDSRAASLLRQRFLDGDPVRVVANRWNVSESLILQRQREAIAALARCLWQEEIEIMGERQARVLNRLESAVPTRLFGVADKQAELLNLLSSEGPPWIVAVDGMGGIGKTSLADAVIRQVALYSQYLDIAWVSARRNLFTLWGGLTERVDRQTVIFEHVLDDILCQFGLEQVARLAHERKRIEAQEFLQAAPYLVVIDNLETASDYESMVPELQRLCGPSRFVLTTRHSLRAFPALYSLTLNELSLVDSLELMRHDAQERGFHDLANAEDDLLAQVYATVGGNPLALKLVVGQAYALPLPQVLRNLHLAQGRAVDELYRHLYWHSWQALSDHARQVLVTMPLVAAQGGDIAQIVAMSELEEETVTTALGELVKVSLVNRRGGVQEYRFSVHQLTETFLTREVLKWQPLE